MHWMAFLAKELGGIGSRLVGGVFEDRDLKQQGYIAAGL